MPFLLKLTLVICFLLSLSCSQTLIAQGEGLEVSLETTVLVGDENRLPFWFYTNSHQKIGETTNFSGVLDGKYRYGISNNDSIEIKASYFYRDGFEDRLSRKELYASYTNKWLHVVAGSKERKEQAYGLSTTNRNVLMSQNARALPGLLLEAPKMQRLLKNIFIDYGLGHFVLNDNRFVDNTWVHYKRVGVKYQWNSKSSIEGRIQHFAQWAGNSPEFGDLPDNFEAFIDVFTARLPSDTSIDGENVNALGNHLGSYYLQYTYKTDQLLLEAYHDHLFEDGSGTRLANFPDGIWGLQLSLPASRIQSSFLYEFISTQNQSANTTAGRDNYFRNSIYRSGWSYDQAIIGLPFINYDKSILPAPPTTSPITNNWLQAHHLGYYGQLGNWSGIFKMSYVKNMGTISDPFTPEVDNIFSYLNVSYGFQNWGSLSLQLGVDNSNTEATNIGGGIQYQYSF